MKRKQQKPKRHSEGDWLNQIYRKKIYVIFAVRDGYIVYNTSKMFEEGHTHISNINTAKYILNLSLYQKVPKRMSDYLLKSLIRISKDPNYIKKIEKMRNNHIKKNGGKKNEI